MDEAEIKQLPVRLDKQLASNFPGISRGVLQTLIKNGKATVNGAVVRDPSKKVSVADEIIIDDSELKKDLPLIELDVLYEDKDCVVINKFVGLLTHSKGALNQEATVASWLAARSRNTGKTNRDGIVHRLDRATSGVMICAKSEDSMKWLQKQFSTRKVKKTYMAVIEERIDPKEAVIDMPIERNPKRPQTFRVGVQGKSAQTSYSTEQYIEMPGRNFSLLKLVPTTGRTHQLRVHLKHLKHPIVGDEFYGGLAADRLYLHALSLEVTLPSKKRMTFSAKLPAAFSEPKVAEL